MTFWHLRKKTCYNRQKNLYAIIRLNNKLKKPEDAGYLDYEIANFVNIKMARKSTALLMPWLTTKEECTIQSVYSWCWDYICFSITYWSPIKNMKLHKANLLTNHFLVTQWSPPETYTFIVSTPVFCFFAPSLSHVVVGLNHI